MYGRATETRQCIEQVNSRICIQSEADWSYTVICVPACALRTSGASRRGEERRLADDTTAPRRLAVAPTRRHFQHVCFFAKDDSPFVLVVVVVVVLERRREIPQLAGDADRQ